MAPELGAFELLVGEQPTAEERELMEFGLARALTDCTESHSDGREAFASGWRDACSLWLLEQRVVREAETYLESNSTTDTRRR